MLRKVLLITVIFGLISCSLLLVYQIRNRVIEKSTAKMKMLYAPIGNFYSIVDSTSTKLPEKNFALVYFNSDCDYCQNELKEFSKNRQLFVNKQLVLVSSENISTIRNTVLRHQLDTENGFVFLKINSIDVFNTFGLVSVPHVFVYDSENRLVKEFKGETTVATIARYLPTVEQ